MQASATWYQSQTIFVLPNPGGTRTVNFCLMVLATKLTGTVVNCKGMAVCGAKVTVARWATSTNSSGAFTLGGLRLCPQTQYVAKICKSGYTGTNVKFTSAPGGSVNIAVTLN